MAHQLAQPLTAVNAYTLSCLRTIRSDRPDFAKIEQNLEKLDQQSRRATTMIRDMATSLRRREPELAIVDLNETLRGALSLLARQAERNGIAVRLDLAPQGLFVRADPALLEQVALDLLRNAFDAVERRDRGAREVAVRSYRGEGGMAEAAIEDTGPGLDDDIAAHAFEPFAAERPEGAGVGLPISRSVVEAHGGHIRLTSSGGGGASVVLALPASERGDSSGGSRRR
jgi:signal transduction histidine kinase